MCGIVGIVGRDSAVEDVLDGLKRLEYRGYDSAGVAAISSNGLERRRAAGKIANLEAELNNQALSGNIALGHTRWATHGAPTTDNAHPHTDMANTWAVVHNGIIENYAELRSQLSNVTFATETDSETIPHVLASNTGTPLQAVQSLQGQLTGAFALGMMCAKTPNTLYATRRGAPLVVGLGDGENYLGSDPMALAPYTNTFIFLEDDDVAVLTAEGVTVYDSQGVEALRPVKTLDVSSVLAGKEGYRHFMLKEIHEQPAVVARLLEQYWDSTSQKSQLPQVSWDWATVPQITLVACGTAYLAALVGKYYIEQLAGIPVQVDVASEFRYRQPPLQKGGVFVAISQSGETADTLAALEYAKEQGQHVITMTNTATSSMARLSDVVLDLTAGPEIAVASTKAFTAMTVSLLLLAADIAQAKGITVNSGLPQALQSLPQVLTQQLSQDRDIQAVAKQIAQADSLFYLGRGLLAPIAQEGALKLKEISYIHAEAYAAGEMKHGPIALLDDEFPVVMLATSSDGLLDKSISNLQEVAARRAPILLIGDTATLDAGNDLCDWQLQVPNTHAMLAPLVTTIPLQLLAYYVALEKGTDVDQPRNLAKSVTVE